MTTGHITHMALDFSLLRYESPTSLDRGIGSNILVHGYLLIAGKPCK